MYKSTYIKINYEVYAVFGDNEDPSHDYGNKVDLTNWIGFIKPYAYSDNGRLYKFEPYDSHIKTEQESWDTVSMEAQYKWTDMVYKRRNFNDNPEAE